MKCFGDKNKTFHCKVVLLDEQELIQEAQETTSGQDLLDVVFQHLNLIETSYFGLRYIDPSNQTHWLDAGKRLSKQLKGNSPFTLYFSVKFYAADPTKLVEEITRYQFFLQIKQDILQGRLPITSELAAELGSFAVQSELGDYDPRRHLPGYVSEFRFITNQSPALEGKIGDLHKKLVGYLPAKAEVCYLEKIKWLDMYGVDLHPVLGEDNTEYFLGLTPSGTIVLRNKVKVGNYFWPRITKVYFRGRFFMLRVKDKNNLENTYGFETPSKSACKHLWRCCVEHHAFFRLTQAAGNSPAAMFSLGSKYRFSGRTEKESIVDAKSKARPQIEFARTPSRRYQRRVVDGNQEIPKIEDADQKPETRTVVSLPTNVTPVSHVYRSTSMTLAPRSDSPRSTRSAPHPAGLNNRHSSGVVNGKVPSGGKREGRPSTRGESPRSVKSASASAGRSHTPAEGLSRRTSSVESQSSVDSRCHRSCSRRRRHSRGRSSDGESEASSKCSGSSRGGRKHRHHHHHRRHRHHSDDSSDPQKHRHRKHRHRNSDKVSPQLVESSGQWAQVQAGNTPSKGHTATVRNLASGYLPNGQEDPENETRSHHHHSSKRRHRKHRSRSRSPSEKHKHIPSEVRKHIDFKLQGSEGMTEAELREIPYTKIETAKNVKIRYGQSPKGKRHRSPKHSKSNSERDSKSPSVHPGTPTSPYSEKDSNENQHNSNDYINGSMDRRRINETNENIRSQPENNNLTNGEFVNGTQRPSSRSNQDSTSYLPHTSGFTPMNGDGKMTPTSRGEGNFTPNYGEDGSLQRNNKRGNQPKIYGPKPSIGNGPPKISTPNGDHNHQNLSFENSSPYQNYQNHSNGVDPLLPYPTNQPQSYNNATAPPNYINGMSHNGHHPPTSSYINGHQNNLSSHHRHAYLQSRDSCGLEAPEDDGDQSSGFMEPSGAGGYASRQQSPALMKNPPSMERGNHFSAMKPQQSPQSSVTSGISVGSSSPSGEGQFARSGSAGSLDVILGPLIQSAMEHQQR